MLSHAYIDGFGSADCEISHEIKDSDCDYLDPILIVFSERGNKDELSLELYARKLTAAQAEGFANAFGEYANALRERANLSGANLSGANANLRDANLSGANLRGADLCRHPLRWRSEVRLDNRRGGGY